MLLDHDSDMLGVKISRVMEREVIVSYNGRDLRIDIEDVNPGDLRDLFGIDFDVKTLLEVETEKTILVKKEKCVCLFLSTNNSVPFFFISTAFSHMIWPCLQIHQ